MREGVRMLLCGGLFACMSSHPSPDSTGTSSTIYVCAFKCGWFAISASAYDSATSCANAFTCFAAKLI